MQKEVLGTIYTEVSEDFQRGIYPIARTIKAEKHDLAVVYSVRRWGDMEVQNIGNIYPSRGQNGNLYNLDGICPTISSGETNTKGNGGIGSNNSPKIIVAMRGRNPDNPSERTIGSPTEQRLEPNSQCICNTLTSVQKDNLLLENVCINDRGFSDKEPQVSIGTVPTLRAETHGNLPKVIENQYRIRKLTPLECWRLMGFSDEDFYKAEEVNSNSQLYKQAGNSIVKNVLMAIFGQMMPGKENIYKEM